MTYIYTIVWFCSGATLVYRPDCNAEGGCHANSDCDSHPRHCRRDDIRAWRPNKITLSSLLPLDLTTHHRFISFLRAVQSHEGRWLIPDTVCKSRSCRQILSRLRADLREKPTKQWTSRDVLIQSAGSISNNARYHSDANIALGPILKMYIFPGKCTHFQRPQ